MTMLLQRFCFHVHEYHYGLYGYHVLADMVRMSFDQHHHTHLSSCKQGSSYPPFSTSHAMWSLNGTIHDGISNLSIQSCLLLCWDLQQSGNLTYADPCRLTRECPSKCNKHLQ